MSAGAATVAAAIPVVLDRRRVYIFPTRAGLTLGVMNVVILLGAINYDNALAYLLAFLLASLFMVAMLHTYRNLAGLRFLAAQAQPVFAGGRAEFHCIVENTTVRPRPALYLKYWPRGLKRAERRYLSRFETRFDLREHERGRVPVLVDADRRGWLTMERLVLHSFYPLGILRAWAYFACDDVALVYPTPRGEMPLPRSDASGGGNVDSSHGGVDDFAGMRPYSPGDPVRAIAWKTLAKSQDLMVKRFHGHAGTRVWLTWQATTSIDGVEARLSQLTQWVLDAERQGARYGLELPRQRIEPGQGAQHREACLAALALFEMS